MKALYVESAIWHGSEPENGSAGVVLVEDQFDSSYPAQLRIVVGENSVCTVDLTLEDLDLLGDLSRELWSQLDRKRREADDA